MSLLGPLNTLLHTFWRTNPCAPLSGNRKLQLSQAGGVHAAVCQRWAKLCDGHADQVAFRGVPAARLYYKRGNHWEENVLHPARSLQRHHQGHPGYETFRWFLFWRWDTAFWLTHSRLSRLFSVSVLPFKAVVFCLLLPFFRDLLIDEGSANSQRASGDLLPTLFSVCRPLQWGAGRISDDEASLRDCCHWPSGPHR